MAERSQKAQDRVREALQKNPDASTRELQDAAQSVEPSVGELSLRQFNAGYVLPLKRTGAAGSRKRKAPARGGTTGRQRQTRSRQATESAPAAAKSAGRGPAAGSSAPEGDRDRVRAALLEFARDFSDAKSRSEVVAVLSNVDRYVDSIVKARG